MVVETVVETVQFCPICRTKTWFVDGVCEWSDGHAVMERAREQADTKREGQVDE
jgi:hypothetical protein